MRGGWGGGGRKPAGSVDPFPINKAKRDPPLKSRSAEKRSHESRQHGGEEAGELAGGVKRFNYLLGEADSEPSFTCGVSWPGDLDSSNPVMAHGFRSGMKSFASDFALRTLQEAYRGTTVKSSEKVSKWAGVMRRCAGKVGGRILRSKNEAAVG